MTGLTFYFNEKKWLFWHFVNTVICDIECFYWHFFTNDRKRIFYFQLMKNCMNGNIIILWKYNFDYISNRNEIDLHETVFLFCFYTIRVVYVHLPPSCHVWIDSSWLKMFITTFYQMNKPKFVCGFMNDVIQFFGIIFHTCETPLFTFTPDNIFFRLHLKC